MFGVLYRRSCKLCYVCQSTCLVRIGVHVCMRTFMHLCLCGCSVHAHPFPLSLSPSLPLRSCLLSLCWASLPVLLSLSLSVSLSLSLSLALFFLSLSNSVSLSLAFSVKSDGHTSISGLIALQITFNALPVHAKRYSTCTVKPVGAVISPTVSSALCVTYPTVVALVPEPFPLQCYVACITHHSPAQCSCLLRYCFRPVPFLTRALQQFH